MSGFDTNNFIGKLYTVVVKNEGDRAWPESILPTSTPAGPPPRPGKTAPAAQPGVMTLYWIDTGDGKEVKGNAEDVAAYILTKSLKAADLMLCPEGEAEWKPAKEFGFADAAF